MRPKRINKSLKEYFGKLIDDELKNGDSVLSKAKKNINDLKSNYNPADNKFKSLKEITTGFKTFMLYFPTDQESFITKWSRNSSLLFYNPAIPGKNKTTAFGKEIIKALNYNGFRAAYADKISSATGIKTCPYCNAALTIVAENEGGKKKSRFQLDHYFPKSKYPLFSISFFNLIPSCGNCNNTKSSKPVVLGKDFHLYANETPIDGYKFEIPKDSVAKYLVTSDLDDVDINFVPGNDGTIANTKHHNKSFDIKGIYNTQKDVIEELFWKVKAYPEEKIDDLSKLLNLPIPVIRRMVLSNYIDIEDIHKRPLAKFQQDIARQLGLIK
jgi:hypothetical protein